ncbi:MAG TPA: hypothetical protein PK595_07895 [Bacteroidota bacterium]|nr:hypothetical protein [Bacteroidota bacterium]
MKRFIPIVCMIIIFSYGASAQYKSQAREQQSVIPAISRTTNSSLLFGWFDVNRLFMHQSYTLSYSTFGGGNGLSLGVYTNSLLYQISDPLSLQFDVSLVHSPFASSSTSNYAKSISGIHLSRAQLTYKPSDSFLLQIQYRQLPTYLLNSSSMFDSMVGIPYVSGREEKP